MKYYPVLLQTEGKKCVVVGGGCIAERKMNALLQAGACVWVISPRVTARIQALAKRHAIVHIPAAYKKRFLCNACLVISATNDRAVNKEVSRDAGGFGIPVNVVDCAEESSFISPAVVRKGDMLIAVSTCGKAPILAKRMKDDAKDILSKYSSAAGFISRSRAYIKSKGVPLHKSRILLSSLISEYMSKKSPVKFTLAYVKKLVDNQLHLRKR
ncbi:MAG: bifunctional precorrin-2 dehydrogenase/sirohydrochlorin ferrochelatase [Candidatus Omnitrophica bacterium]|nr:bifunctional precorrin-2 dehydrogenase/sirohydrochlorin ferrochelatase [Candidatus Omnitrophota bacterium]